MAEIKNSFLRSKMNKDLDDRLIPNGEYRDAQNISVGKSEDDDIGALENVLGNALIAGSQLLTYNDQTVAINGAGNAITITGDLTGKILPGMNVTGIDSATGLAFANIITTVTFANNQTSLGTAYDTQTTTAGSKINAFFPLEIIGQHTDAANDRIILFLTNKDVNQAWPPNINNYYNPITNAYNYILSYTPSQGIEIIAQGAFLNFSVNYPMSGITMIENLLFFTDNYNQPRQVNVTTGIAQNGNYYTNEDHVSVAKYSPYIAPSLIRETNGTIQGTIGGSAAAGYQIDVAANSAITIGMSVVSRAATGNTPRITGDDFIYVTNVSTANSITTVTLSPASAQTTAIPTPVVGDIVTFLTSTMTNESKTSNWPGDPDFLEDRFVRFSYRFKYEDNEYSLMAPFSQIAFVPMQKGYFFNGNEDDAYQSTVVTWMENFIQQIQILINLPTSVTNLSSQFKVAEIDILYKESDAVAVKVLETIDVSNNASGISTVNTGPIYKDGSTLVYTYQSRKPYKTLPEAATTRVYDKTPVIAKTQESAGNRIIYGNYYDKHTPPSHINYNVAFVDKDSNLQNNWIEYPNHSVKQNRNYQVGFVLSDRYGRQSPVILSSVLSTDPSNYVGSTVYAPYEEGAFDVKGWFGKALQVIVNSQINPPKNLSTGEPGLYNSTLGASYNPLGWYSYKVVVRQQEQDYYNVYLPGILNGYPKQISTTPVTGVTTQTYNANAVLIQLNSSPDISVGDTIANSGSTNIGTVTGITQNGTGSLLDTTPITNSVLSGSTLTFDNPKTFIPFPTGENGKTANIVLFNDNINKVPRDLQEVGPEQKQFRSSVQLFGRVQNTISSGTVSNVQFYGISPDYARASHTVVAIGEAEDLNIVYDELSSPGGQQNFYQIDTNPLIGRLSTAVSVGVISTTDVATNMQPFLAIYETEPTESLLDIFWETTTTGLISELNAAVAVGNTDPSFFTDTSYSQFENQQSNGVQATDSGGGVSIGGTTLTLTSADSNIVATMEVYNSAGDRVGTVSNVNGVTITITSALVAIAASSAVTFQSTAAGNQYGRYITDFFFPSTSSGVNITNSTVQIVSVYADDNTNVTSKFGIYGPGTLAKDGANNVGAYRLFITEDTFTFLNNSLANTSARDKYTFTLSVTVGSNPAINLTTLGSLSNIVPIVTNNLVSALTTTTTILNYKTSNLVTNGSNQLNFNLLDLRFTLGTVTPTPSGGFSISQYSGIISQTANTNTQGTYTLPITIDDAVNSTNNGNGNGQLSTTIQQEVIIGAQAVNNTAIGPTQCVSDVVLPWSDSNLKTDLAVKAEGLFSDGNSAPYDITAVWYVADSNLANSDLPITPDMPSGFTPYRVGTGAHLTGDIAFLLNARIEKVSSIGNNPRSSLTWRMWRRPVGGAVADWTEGFADINGITASGGVALAFDSTYGATSGETMYNQVVKAFARGSGSDNFEYCIAAVNMGNTMTGGDAKETIVAWVRSTDLNYPACVVENGSTVVNSYSGSTYYGYRHTSGGTLPYTCGASTQGPLYSPIPYGEYINQFFTNTARTTAWSPVNYDTSAPVYRWNTYTDSSPTIKPFTSLVLSGTFTSSDGAVYRAGATPHVYSCWPGNAVATTIQRQGKS